MALNVGSYTGHNRIRRIILGDKFQRVSTQEEVDGMINLLKEDLKEGSLGLSTGLEYDPGVYSTSEEIAQLAKELKPFKARYISHIRSEDRALWQALNEIIHIGKVADVPVQISHAKLAMKSLWGQSDKLISKLDSAQSAGIDITADLYPYRYWQSSMRAVFFPDRNFKDRNSATFALTELTTLEGVILNNYSPDSSYAGKTLAEISTIRKTNPVQTLLDLVDEVEKQRGDESIIATSMTEEDIVRIMKWPYTNICSDGNSDGLHPRGYGSFTKILRYYVNETQTLTLEEAIHKMTKQTADNLNLKRIGEIKTGNFADLVLFDPNTIADHATYEEPHALSTGISRVIVNGIEVLVDGNSTHQFPGRTIRRAN
jgi:N-acyl-D-amino-acid deacylase